MRVTRVGQQLALRVDDGHRANVLALQRSAAGEFDQGDVLHGGNCGGFWTLFFEIRESWRRAAFVGERTGVSGIGSMVYRLG